jgi:hypothetical protein
MLLALPVASAQEAPPPSPSDSTRAKELYENGAELYAEGLYEEAILAWKEGYAMSQLPDFLFNIAGAQERIGDWKSALDTLSKYRAFASTDERETLARRIRNLEERLAEEGPVKPAPAPAPQPVAPGPVPEPAPTTSSRRSLEPVVVGSLFGVGGIGLVTGVITGLGSSAAGSAAQEQCVEGAAGLLCPADADDELGKERSRALVADLAFGLGSASLLGGVVVLVVPSGKSGTARLQLRPDGAVVTFVR